MTQRGRPRQDALASTNEKEPQTDKTEVNIMQEAEVQEETKVKKKGTPPNWKPASQLPRLKAPKGWTAKWSNPAKLTERLSEGWQIMKPSDNVGERILNVDVNDSGSLTGSLKYRDLVAIMLPEELKEARDIYIRNENKEAMKGVLKETDEKLKEGGVETYTPKGQEGRVVIN